MFQEWIKLLAHIPIYSYVVIQGNLAYLFYTEWLADLLAIIDSRLVNTISASIGVEEGGGVPQSGGFL